MKLPEILTAVLILTAGAAVSFLDFTDQFQGLVSVILKYSIVVSCFFIGFRYTFHVDDAHHTRLLRAAFLILLAADLFLTVLNDLPGLKNPYLFLSGVTFFMVFQSLVIRRNLGLFKLMDHVLAAQVLIQALLLAVAFILTASGHGGLAVNGLGALYLLVLALALFTAVRAYRLGLLPQEARLPALFSAALFFLCDVSITLEILTGRQGVAGGLVWMFYTPALLCFAWSVKPGKVETAIRG